MLSTFTIGALIAVALILMLNKRVHAQLSHWNISVGRALMYFIGAAAGISLFVLMQERFLTYDSPLAIVLMLAFIVCFVSPLLAKLFLWQQSHKSQRQPAQQTGPTNSPRPAKSRKKFWQPLFEGIVKLLRIALLVLLVIGGLALIFNYQFVVGLFQLVDWSQTPLWQLIAKHSNKSVATWACWSIVGVSVLILILILGGKKARESSSALMVSLSKLAKILLFVLVCWWVWVGATGTTLKNTACPKPEFMKGSLPTIDPEIGRNVWLCEGQHYTFYRNGGASEQYEISFLKESFDKYESLRYANPQDFLQFGRQGPVTGPGLVESPYYITMTTIDSSYKKHDIQENDSIGFHVRIKK